MYCNYFKHITSFQDPNGHFFYPFLFLQSIFHLIYQTSQLKWFILLGHGIEDPWDHFPLLVTIECVPNLVMIYDQRV